jgi:tRNA-splicing ligase RtcB
MRKSQLEKIEPNLWEIPKKAKDGMRVPARVYATESMLDAILEDRSLDQLANVATLPGIHRHALVMPDVHEGYGFPIGGVAAFDPEDGVISPGGIGYDINCGVRMLRSPLTIEQIRPQLAQLARALAKEIPSGVGRGGSVRLKGDDFDRILASGARRAVEIGFGTDEDLEKLEARGAMDGADPSAVSQQAKDRGRDQLGTMGAGNHFVEVARVETLFDAAAAARLDLVTDQAVVLIHTGSRGLGHQIATDHVRIMTHAMAQYGITIPDRELSCVPFRSPEGQRYFSAMAAGANFAWANRQIITAEVRRAWRTVLGPAGGELSIVWDVAHNVAKLEQIERGGARRSLLVHRKGATRSFPGEPVLIPGSMGTGSYLMIGGDRALEETFGSCCHGAGRTMSRKRAKQDIDAGELRARLRAAGIHVESGSAAGLVEEAPEAYKDVDQVVAVVHAAGIARKVARLRPVAVVKG